MLPPWWEELREGVRIKKEAIKKGLAVSEALLFLSGGAGRDRTDGLMNAIHALSQLSYSPTELWKNNNNPFRTCQYHIDRSRIFPV